MVIDQLETILEVSKNVAIIGGINAAGLALFGNILSAEVILMERYGNRILDFDFKQYRNQVNEELVKNKKIATA